jgi:hypothetical protein
VWRSLAQDATALSVAGTASGGTRASPSQASTRRSSSEPIEIHFSILAGKALTPSHFAGLDKVEQRVLSF